MKKLCFLSIVILTVFLSNAQILNIPDADFKAKLIYSSPSAGIGKDQQGNNITIDTNHNNEIELSEALTVYGLSVTNGTISDLSGLENFSNLTFFNCNGNSLTEISIVNTLPNLKGLSGGFNSLTSLDLTPNTALENIFFNYNQLTNLEIGSCVNLKNISCNFNQLTSLNTSNLTHLEALECTDNFLTQLNVSNSVNLYWLICRQNNITSLDLTGLGQTTIDPWMVFFLDCSSNNLSTLDTTVMFSGARPRIECGSNPNLTSIYAKNGAVFMDDNPKTPPFPGLYIGNLPSLQYICVDSFNIPYVQDKLNLCGCTGVSVDSACSLSIPSEELATGFSIYPNPVKTTLMVENRMLTDIKSIKIYNLLSQLIFNTQSNSRSIDVSDLKTGTYFIKIKTDKGFYNSKFIKE